MAVSTTNLKKYTFTLSKKLSYLVANKYVPVGDQKPTGEWEQQEQHSQV